MFVRGTPSYEWHRLLHNGACNHIYPALVVRPESTEDVSLIVSTARQYGVELSVRSGGHGYQCTGTKQDSLNIDMRSIRTVKVLDHNAALIGAGNTWKQVT